MTSSPLHTYRRRLWTCSRKCAPTHFTRAEAPILGLYCNAIHLARFYSGKIGTGGARGENHRWWVENTRLAASLATKLRLTPQTRFDGRAAEKKAGEPYPDEAPWIKYGRRPLE